MIVTGFKNEKNVEEYLQAVKEYTDWEWNSWDSPTYDIGWKGFFTEFFKKWWFCIDYKDDFLYWSVNVYWKGKEQINYKEAILKLKWEAMKEWDIVYVSDYSEEKALKYKEERILLRKCNDWYVCVHRLSQRSYEQWAVFQTTDWNYVVPVPDVGKKEYTIKKLEEKLWETIKIIK